MEAEQLSTSQPGHETERRDIPQIIRLWQRNASEDGGPPLLSTFDLSQMKAKRDHRFLICSDQTVQNAAFIVYGPKFAQLLGLPDKMTRVVSLYQLIPGRYRPIFAEGCGAVMTKDKPAQFSGTFDHVAFNCAELHKVERRLQQHGIKYRQSAVPLTGRIQLFFNDPAGNGVELNFKGEGNS